MQKTGLVVSALCVLACGGLFGTVEPGPHLRQLCALQGHVGLAFEPVAVDLPFTPLSEGVRIKVDADGYEVDLQRVEPDGLVQALTEMRERESHLVEALGEGEVTALVELDPAAAGDQVLALLQALVSAELPTVDFIVGSRDKAPALPYPDSDYGMALKADLVGVSPEVKAMRAAEEITKLVALCPGAAEVFAAVSNVSPEMKCKLIAQGLEESLPTCLVTDSDKLVTAMQVVMEPTTATRTTALRLRLSNDEAAEADVLAMPEGATWATLAPSWAPHHGQIVKVSAADGP